jgi:hypothetical protein
MCLFSENTQWMSAAITQAYNKTLYAYISVNQTKLWAGAINGPFTLISDVSAQFRECQC